MTFSEHSVRKWPSSVGRDAPLIRFVAFLANQRSVGREPY